MPKIVWIVSVVVELMDVSVMVGGSVILTPVMVSILVVVSLTMMEYPMAQTVRHGSIRTFLTQFVQFWPG
jgi:hypothetical protein